MKYKVEAVIEKLIVYEGIFDKFSHPNQVVRSAVNASTKHKKYDFITVFVVNENGEVWVYAVEFQNTKYRVYPIDNNYIHKGEIIKIFSGVKTIRSLVVV